ncbi:MAG TPA: hypothetical protein PK177_20635 [Burkholderiaceae bacterium]|nr:hypothetical protein [Burkholderiaceae bacterium]
MPQDDMPLDHVRALVLPDAPPSYESSLGTADMVPGSGARALALGSQLAEFTEHVAPDVRAAVSESLLLAQLAANKAAGEADVFRWYDVYVSVLQHIGWQTQSMSFETQSLSDRDADMHQAILPVVTAMFGPVAAAGSLVLSVLHGLREMDRDRPWIMLFDRASQHASGAKFQVSRVDSDVAGDPGIELMCFGIEAKRAVTQVLFFRFADTGAQLKKGQGSLSMAKGLLMETNELVTHRVRPFVAEYVNNIEI